MEEESQRYFPNQFAQLQRFYLQFWGEFADNFQRALDPAATTAGRYGAFEQWLSALAEPPTLGATGDSSAAGSRWDESSGAELARLLGQAYVLWMNSGLRYTRRLLETHGRNWSSLMERCSATASGSVDPAQARQLLMEGVQAYFREISDIAYQEARLLQTELEKLQMEARWFSEAASGSGSGSGKQGAARRHVKAKD